MRKRWLCIGIVVIMTLLVFVSVAISDNEKTSGLFTYRLKGNGTAVITNFNWEENGNNDIYVPRQLDGYEVTEIGDFAFSFDDNDAYVAFYNALPWDSNYGPLYNYQHFGAPLGKAVVVKLPDTITVIGERAFFLTQIQSIEIPDSVQLIKPGAFAGCYGMKYFTVASGNAVYATIDGVLYNKIKKELVAVPAGRDYTSDALHGRANEFKIPEGIVKIGDYAFWGLDLDSQVSKTNRRISVVLSTTVEEIGDYAFAETCVGETSLNKLNNVKTIGNYAFANSRNITIDWSKSVVETIGDFAFAGSKVSANQNGIRRIIFPSTLKQIGEGAFSNAEVDAPKGIDLSKTSLKVIPPCAFENTTVPASFTSEDITIALPNTLEEIQEEAFKSFQITSGEQISVTVIIPESVSEIKNEAFMQSNVNPIFTKANNLTSIGDRAFYKHFFTIEKVVLPNSVKKLGAGAFYSESLKSILIPDAVADIGDNVCDRANTVMEVVPGSYAALYASENGYPVSNTTGDDTSWLD